ncbi:nucleotidyltransferase domain-containing protein [Candidatus Pacearchaeota archaeon]|nr:nucleotidyltransferase domain-containing protein [Candidatus Pacearchaeota archaeon]
MVLGYDEPRPTRKNYDSFLERLVAGLEKLNNPEICLMLYGSYVREDFVPGRSDIDGVLIFPRDVIIGKSVMRYLSKTIANAQRGNNVPIQITPTDLRTMSDGRFNSYEENFKNYFKEEGKIIFGHDYRDRFRFEPPSISEQTPLRFNLRKSRIGLLHSEYDKEKNYGKFLENLNKAMNAASRGSKQILFLMDGKLRKNRFSALDEIRNIFPQVDTKPLKRIKDIYDNPRKLDGVYKSPIQATRLFYNSVTFFEEMIKAYLDANPRSQER